MRGWLPRRPADGQGSAGPSGRDQRIKRLIVEEVAWGRQRGERRYARAGYRRDRLSQTLLLRLQRLHRIDKLCLQSIRRVVGVVTGIAEATSILRHIIERVEARSLERRVHVRLDENGLA